jgi:hypothetical protein
LVRAQQPFVQQQQVRIPEPPGGTGLGRPYIPPRGDWLQVLTATDRWLVLQNAQGQQFPVSYEAVDIFVMRWPISLDRIGPADLVEVNGIDLGTNKVGTDHIDVFRGSARNLVTPTFQRLVGFNRVVTLFDIERQNVFGYNFQYALTPEELMMPSRYHVVSTAMSVNPFLLAAGGNNALEVVASPDGLSMAEVTAGVPSYVRAGDVAYVVPILDETTPRTLTLSQLVIYKNVPTDVFGR